MKSIDMTAQKVRILPFETLASQSVRRSSTSFA
jgi:hypothetical protein